MATIFEKTMQACRDAKALTEKANKATKAPAKKNLSEKTISRKRLKKESDDDDVEMDVADDIVAVIDPDVDADEMTSVAQGFQQLVDDAGANEIPETDEYIDDQIYGCPICGNKFFSETPMTDGDKCPVCGEEANGFVLVGEVASDDKDDSKADDSDIEDSFDFDGEEVDVEIKGDVEKDSDKEEESESKKVRREGKALRKPMRRRTESKMNLDDVSFNKYLNRFVRENYNNAKSFVIKSARQNGTALKLEGKISFKSGKSKRVVLNCNYKPNSRIMTARDNGAFKVESKSAPFMFKIRTVGNVIKCEGMKYNFKTTAKIQNEDKKVAVHGSYLGEARRAVRPTRRTVESKRRITRRPSARKVAESRRVRSVRPTARKTVESRRIARKPMARRSSVRTMESRRLARRRIARPVSEGRRITRRPARKVESTRTTRRVTRRPMSRVGERKIARRPSVRRSESARVTRTRRPSVRRSESVRATRRTVRPTRRVESKRNVSRRVTRR